MLTREQLFTLAAVTLLATVFVGGVGWAIAAGDTYETPAERQPDGTDTDCENPGVEIMTPEDGTGIQFEETCEPEENESQTTPSEEPGGESEETPEPTPDEGTGDRV